MAGFWSRVKNWIGTENLTYLDINAEFNNIIEKVGADTVSGANSTNGSAPTVNAMQATENPGTVGAEVLSATIQEDIKQLRYQLNAIIGSAQWYSSPAQSIASLNGLINGVSYVPPNRIISGRMDANDQPMFLVPSGSADTITLKATTTNLATYINGTAYSFTADATITGLSVAPSSNNTCTVNDASLSGGQSTKAQGERGTVITITSIGSAISALNGTYAAFKKGTEYFIAEVDTSNNRLKNAWRGVGFDSGDTWLARAALSNSDTITLMKLAWIFGSNAGALDVTYDKPSVSFVSPTSPAIGDYWLDLSVGQWKKYSGTVWVNQSSVLLGLCIQDSTNCKCARSFDFFKGLANLNTMELEYVDATNVRTNRLGTRASVYGTVFSFDYDFVKWNTTAQLDSGVSLANSTTYWCYITDKGDRFISNVQPYDRRFDLLGHYMPNKPWRCVGEFQTDGSSNVSSGTVAFDRYHQSETPALTAGLGTGAQYLKTNSGGSGFQWGASVPTVQKFTSGSGTYTTPANAAYIRVRMVGGGGGGSGSGGNGGDGGDTTFGTSLLAANHGSGGGSGGGVGGAGGSASLGSGPVGLAISGGQGGAAAAGLTNAPGGNGAPSAFGGGGQGGSPGAFSAGAAATNSGAGGGGKGQTGGGSLPGGGAGGFVDAIISAPSATYSYAVGAAGSAGTTGGAAGGSGIILVEEYY